MKNILYILVAFFMLTSCEKKGTELLFDQTPDQRMTIGLTDLKAKLLGAQHGWKVYNETLNKGNYGYFMTFDDKDRVSMVADINNSSAEDMQESTYKLKLINGPVLSFETYNYITLLNDPNPSVIGGTRAEGFRSDIEFNYVRSTEDSVFFKGRRYSTELVLMRATEEEKNQYTNSQFGVKIEGTKENYFDITNPNITVPFDGGQLTGQIELDFQNKKGKITSITPEGKIISDNSNFFFTLKGLEFNKGLQLGDLLFKKINISDSEAIAIEANGADKMIESSLRPIVPLYALLGYTYKSLFSPFKTIFPGTTAKGKTILDFFHNNLDNRYTGYTFNSGTIRLKFDPVNQRLNLEGWSNQNGNAGWITTIVYNYEMTENGLFTFTLRTAASGGYVAKLLNEEGKETLHKFLTSNTVKFDYFANEGVLYGKMMSVEDSDLEMTFILE